MNSFEVSFSSLFGENTRIRQIEIPLIQRDYAQGRREPGVDRIRREFLDALQTAVSGGSPLNLDFVYGEVSDWTLRPLDGQQRLTTLFLLHWYLAWRAGALGEDHPWKRFSYATRPTARTFCARLASHSPPHDVTQPSLWLTDQHWYLHTWKHDPTIQSMLIVIDAIHEVFATSDHTAAWNQLMDGAVTFHLLPLNEWNASQEDVYIKMNSRGRPLTPFENFKARFEQTIEQSYPERLGEFASKIDGVWSDMLWPYHGGDFLIDQEFLRYFHFLSEICVWRAGHAAHADNIEVLAYQVFGKANPKCHANLDFVIEALDTWVDTQIPATFDALFSTMPSDGKCRLFTKNASANLLLECFESYGKMRGQNRVFSIQNTLLLYAVVLHRLNDTPDFPKRLRQLRNLCEASQFELRLTRMPELVADVGLLITTGDLDSLSAFRPGQIEHEAQKVALLDAHPDLKSSVHELEDHPLLRGTLIAFELNPDNLPRRADAFGRLFANSTRYPALTGALLAVGDYSRRQKNRRYFQFGAPKQDQAWRELFTGRAKHTQVDLVFGQFLDLTSGVSDVNDCLAMLEQDFLCQRETEGNYDWRYCLVRYPVTRTGRTGLYVGLDGTLGYSIGMMHTVRVSGNYRDVFLQAIVSEAHVGDAVVDPWFSGYEDKKRWLALSVSGAGITSIEAGLQLRPPTDEKWRSAFDEACAKHGVGADHLIPIEKRPGTTVDAVDRVLVGAALLRDLVSVGC